MHGVMGDAPAPGTPWPHCMMETCSSKWLPVMTIVMCTIGHHGLSCVACMPNGHKCTLRCDTLIPICMCAAVVQEQYSPLPARP